jgi:hypothetical protein
MIVVVSSYVVIFMVIMNSLRRTNTQPISFQQDQKKKSAEQKIHRRERYAEEMALQNGATKDEVKQKKAKLKAERAKQFDEANELRLRTAKQKYEEQKKKVIQRKPAKVIFTVQRSTAKVTAPQRKAQSKAKVVAQKRG